MNIDVSGKIIVITGASKGIGGELAKKFAKEGAIIAMNYYQSVESANNIFSEVIQYSPKSILIRANITDADEVSMMYHKVASVFGYIDVLINNAGICDDSMIQMMSLEQWKKVIDVNLTGVFLCSREFSKMMIKQNKGKIINIASLKGQEGAAGQVNYSSSKAGVIGFTKSLAKELGQYGISANAICPGFIITDLNKHDDIKKKIAKQKSSIKNDCALNELSNFVIYISSDCFTNTSGRIFNLDSRIL